MSAANDESEEEEEILLYDKTPVLEAWIEDAEKFGFPDNIQKGLAFLIGLNLAVTPQESPEKAIRLSKRLSSYAPNPPDEIGGEFYDGKIADLLSELAYRVDPDFSPRVLPDKSRVYEKPKKHLLPDYKVDEANTLEKTDIFMTSLLEQIGENIEEDIEGSYLAGLKFAASYAPMDIKGLQIVAGLPMALLPPQFTWFFDCVLDPFEFTPEQIRSADPVRKILPNLLKQFRSYPIVEKKTIDFNYFLYHSAPDVVREDVWEIQTPNFTWFAATSRVPMYGEDEISKSEIKDMREELIRVGNKPPPKCNTEEEAFTAVCKAVIKVFGYNPSMPDDDLYIAQKWIRRCCVVYICAINEALRPNWNKGCLGTE
jgi:hypothetical protein